MNVLTVATSFKPVRGGRAEYVYQLLRYLHELGDRIVVVAQDNPAAPTFDSRCAFPVIRYDMRALREQGLLGYRDRYRTLAEYVDFHAPDVLLSASLDSEADVTALLARRRGLPFATICYGGEVNALRQQNGHSGWLDAATVRLGLRQANRVFCVSHPTRDLVTALGVAPARTTIIPPGVSLSTLGAAHPRLAGHLANRLGGPGRPILLTVGTLVPRRGIATTLEALKTVVPRFPDLLYVIAGEGPEREALEKRALQLALEKNVTFTGYLSDAMRNAYYQAADIFVMPNCEPTDGDIEGFGMVFLEANFYGKPVIAGRSGGAVDAVVDGETGILVEPDSPEATAEAILRLLEIPAYARRLGNQGRQRVRDEFSWVRQGRKFRQALAELVSDGGADGRG